MNDPAYRIAAIVPQQEEGRIHAAARWLTKAMEMATGQDWPVVTVLLDPDAPVEADALVVAGILLSADRIARWQHSASRIFACTDSRAMPGDRAAVRRANLKLLHISREYGVEVVDLDRLTGQIGWRDAAPVLDEIAGLAIAATILAGPVGDDDAASENARAFINQSQHIKAILQLDETLR